VSGLVIEVRFHEPSPTCSKSDSGILFAWNRLHPARPRACLCQTSHLRSKVLVHRSCI
jgi:hypothetical protein